MLAGDVAGESKCVSIYWRKKTWWMNLFILDTWKSCWVMVRTRVNLLSPIETCYVSPWTPWTKQNYYKCWYSIEHEGNLWSKTPAWLPPGGWNVQNISYSTRRAHCWRIFVCAKLGSIQNRSWNQSALEQNIQVKLEVESLVTVK